MKSIRILFTIAALYDGVLGIAFLFFGARVFERFGVVPPNHMGYVHFPATLLIVFAIMFLTIAASPNRHRNLIVYGIMLKICYCGVVTYHWMATGVPGMWKPFVAMDFVFAVLFVLAYTKLPRHSLH